MDEIIGGVRLCPETLATMRAPIPREDLVAHAWRVEEPEFVWNKRKLYIVEVGAGVLAASEFYVRNAEASHLTTDVYPLRNARLRLVGEKGAVLVYVHYGEELLGFTMLEQTPDNIEALTAEVAKSA